MGRISPGLSVGSYYIPLHWGEHRHERSRPHAQPGRGVSAAPLVLARADRRHAAPRSSPPASSSSFGQRRMSRSLALINTTIPPPLKPARDGPDARAHREDRVGRQRGDEMNLALSASQLTVQAIPERGVCGHAAASLESRPAHGHCRRDRARAGAGSAYRGAKSARRGRPPGNHRTPRSDPLTRVSRSRQVDPAATCLVTGGWAGTDQRDTAATP